MNETPPTITETEFALIGAFAQGYINALVETNNVWEGFDVFYAYGENWDVNIHMNGEPNTIHVVAHPQSLGADGYMNTDMQRWVEIGQYHTNGTLKIKVTS